MFNYQIIIEYLGTNFVGWQIQKKGSSIQSKIQKVLSKVLKKIKINGSGRTDARSCQRTKCKFLIRS